MKPISHLNKFRRLGTILHYFDRKMKEIQLKYLSHIPSKSSARESLENSQEEIPLICWSVPKQIDESFIWIYLYPLLWAQFCKMTVTNCIFLIDKGDLLFFSWSVKSYVGRGPFLNFSFRHNSNLIKFLLCCDSVPCPQTAANFSTNDSCRVARTILLQSLNYNLDKSKLKFRLKLNSNRKS